jgi:Flp pilus assembly pilin Flp
MTIHRNRRPLSSRRHTGQGMTEYIIIVALVAIAAIATFSFFGQTVRGQMAAIASQLSGKTGTTGIGNAQGAAGKANTQSGTLYGLQNYNQSSRVISHYHHYLSLAFLPSHRFLPLLSSLSPFSLSLSTLFLLLVFTLDFCPFDSIAAVAIAFHEL